MREYFDQGQAELRCEWGMQGVERLADVEVIVIVDVLSFTTCVDVAIARGVTIIPYPWKDDSAEEFAREERATLAGPRGAGGREFSLSPASLMTAPPGLRLVLPSPNGASLAFAAKSRPASVLAGCLRNAAAVARRARQLGQRIAVIPAGERWPDGSLRPAIEDWLGAGAILAALPGSRSPETDMAIAAFHAARPELQRVLHECVSGRELVERGFACDVELAAELDVSSAVPTLENGVFRPQGPAL